MTTQARKGFMRARVPDLLTNRKRYGPESAHYLSRWSSRMIPKAVTAVPCNASPYIPKRLT